MKKTIVLLIITIIIVIGLIAYMLFFNKIDYSTYESINEDYYIIDRTEECAEMLEEIYNDDEYIYYLNCLKSETIFIINKETKEEFTLKYAFDNNIVTIEELIDSSITVNEIYQFQDVVEVLGTNIKLREDHNIDSSQIENYMVTINEKYYLLDTYVGETYTWYKIDYQDEQGWFADNGNWARTYKIELDETLNDSE